MRDSSVSHVARAGRVYAKAQILIVEDLLASAEVKMPPTATTFKQAQRAEGGDSVQGHLGL